MRNRKELEEEGEEKNKKKKLMLYRKEAGEAERADAGLPPL